MGSLSVSQSGFPPQSFCLQALAPCMFQSASFFLRNQLVCLMAFSCSLARLIARLISLAIAFLVVASCLQSCHNIGRFFGGVVLPAGFSASAPITFFSSVGLFRQPCGLTKRAPDARGVCPTFEYFFWLRVFSTSQATTPPTHTLVTQTVSPLLWKHNL